MQPKLLRLAFVFEFLLALLTIFTAWSEIGGQTALDAMNWFWKAGFSIGLALSVVGYSSAIISEDRMWTMRSARWLTALCILILASGVVTYYFQLQVDATDSDEPGTISLLK